MNVGFVLLSSPERPIPSTRVAALNLLPPLAERGVSVHVLYAPDVPSETPQLPDTLVLRAQALGLSVVVLQKVRGPAVLRLVQDLRRAGIASVYLVCDLVDPVMAAVCDATVVVTEFLKSLYPPTLSHKIYVVHDGIERPECFRSTVSDSTGEPGRPLKAVLVTSSDPSSVPVLGNPPPWLELTIVGAYPTIGASAESWRHKRWMLTRQKSWQARWQAARFLAHPRIRLKAWSPDGVYEEMAKADIGVIPIDAAPPACEGKPAPAWQVKSENRLTLKMAAGLPVVATPIPSYLPIIDQGRNGYLARSQVEWQQALMRLCDPKHREQMGAAARASVLPRFSIAAQADLLLSALRAVHAT